MGLGKPGVAETRTGGKQEKAGALLHSTFRLSLRERFYKMAKLA